jgi:hypothetical protein
MNWEAIGAIGEILGATAVAVTLAYLVVQLRQNTKAMKAQTRSSITDQILDINNSVLANPELLEARDKANSDLPLTAEEQKILTVNMVSWLRHWENVHFQYRNGTYDESEYLAQRVAWQHQLTVSTFWRERWVAMFGMFSPEFVSELDALLTKIEDRGGNKNDAQHGN